MGSYSVPDFNLMHSKSSGKRVIIFYDVQSKSHISNESNLISASVLFKILGARALEATNFIHSLNDLIIFNLATLVYPLYSIITFDVRKILSAY